MDQLKKEIKGNGCIFFIFNIFNLALVIESLVVLSLGIYLWVQVGNPEIFAIVFIILGVIEFFLGYMGFVSRKSSAKLTCYIYFLGLIFLAQTVATVLGMVFKGDIIDKAAEHSKSEKSEEEIKKLLTDHVDIAIYGTISAVVIQLFCILTSCWYRNNLRNNKDNFYHSLESEERKTSLQKREAEIKDKYAEKRADYRSKYNY